MIELHGDPICRLCGEHLNRGEALVPALMSAGGGPERYTVVHASCAQELRGEYEG